MIVLIASMAAGAVFAGHHSGGPGFHHGPAPRFHHAPPMHHHSSWGRGGRNFWPGFVGGVIGGVIGNAICDPAPVVVTPTVVTTPTVITPTVVAPTVVTQPVITQPVIAQPVQSVQNVWVEGRYIDQVQANGTMVRVWQPGHYEQRTVIVQ